MKNTIAWNKKKTQDLFAAVLKLKTKDECRRFFRDLCTLEEVAEMADRWQSVRMIKENKLSYRDIAKKLKMSTTTVARVGSWLKYGEGGYRLILKRMGYK